MTCEFIPSLRNADICKTCGVAFSQHGKRNPTGRKPHLTAEQDRQLIVWFNSCRTVKQKAAEWGVAPATLYNALARHDPSRRGAK